MHKAAQQLKKRQDSNRKDVDGEREHHHSPHDQSSMPSLRRILWMIQDDEALDLRCHEEADTGDGGLPSKHRDPTCVTVSGCQSAVPALIPCIQVLNALILGGASSAVQWYCAPASGQMDAISPSDKASAIVPVIDSSIPHTKAAGPPFNRPGVNPLLSYYYPAQTYVGCSG
jgi:hypothetical protein